MTRSNLGLTVVVLLAAVAGASPAAPEAAQPASAEAILDGYVAASGGEAVLGKIRTAKASGTMEIVGMGIRGALTVYQARPDRFAVVFASEALGGIRSGSDGKLVWEVSDLQGPRLLEGSERAVTVRSTTIDGLLRWREQYTKVELVGEATVGEASCWQLTMTPAEGNPETWYLDKGTGLLVKMTMTLSHVMGQVPVEATFGDYRTVDGITMPFRSTQKVLMQEMLTVLESVEHNVELPADAFQPPPEVLALVAKATPPPVPTAPSASP